MRHRRFPTRRGRYHLALVEARLYRRLALYLLAYVTGLVAVIVALLMLR